MQTNQISAACLAPGQAGCVIELRQSGVLQHRLLDLGIVPGAVLRRRYTAPSGSPIAYEVQGMVIAIRKADAERLFVEGCPWTP